MFLPRFLRGAHFQEHKDIQ
uniref:Uncharacterized protein n=1 Tax=Anguilla anguilla TaxID=7936 RepID=A0A0E9PPB8_ANGAN